MKKACSFTNKHTMNLKNIGLQFDFFIQSLLISAIVFSGLSGAFSENDYFFFALLTLPILGGWQLLSALLTGIFKKSKFHWQYLWVALAYLIGLWGFSEFIQGKFSYFGDQFPIFCLAIPCCFALFYYYKTFKFVY